MIKNTFWFIIKAPSLFKIFKFLSRLLVYVKKPGLISKLRLISRFLTSSTGQQIITIQILSNILKSKGNQTTKFGQLIKCNMRKSFLEKSYTNFGGETIERPFTKKLKLSISLNQQSEILPSLILLYVLVKDYRKLKSRGWPLTFSSYKAVLKNENRFATNPPTSFCVWFFK